MHTPQRTFSHEKKYSGLSLIETVIGVALFAFIAMTLYTTYQRVFIVARYAQARIDAIAVGVAQMEIARNLSYSNVGTIAGIPAGTIPQVQTIVSGGKTYIATTTVRNIDFPLDGTAGGAPDDLSPADNKLVEIELGCITCVNFRPLVFTTTVAPLNLEGNSANGSLFVRAADSSGALIGGAAVRVVNNALVPPIDLLDVTTVSGMLQLIDAPPSNQSYEITVSKAGYSTEKTYGAPIANPVKPHATVVAQTVTQLTFTIDPVITLNIASVSPSCAAVPGAHVELKGAKKIGTGPDVFKYDNFFDTDGSGLKVLNDIEYDLYTLLATSTTHEVAGLIPLFPFQPAPGSTQNVKIIMVPKDSPSVMVTVQDNGTKGPITGATVTMDDGVNPPIVQTTGRGYLRQTDWSGGSGLEAFTDPTRYWSNDGNVDPNITPGDAKLTDTLGLYAQNGWLESSTFDTGASATNYYQFNSFPTSQPTDPMFGDSRAEYQIATGNSTSSWTYLGPDGTANTYYTSTTTDIAAAANGKRYLRYKMFLSTASTSLTPTVSDVQFNFTSACVPPGQVLFQGLPDGNYTLTVSAPGYSPDTSNVVVNAGTPWQEAIVSLVP